MLGPLADISRLDIINFVHVNDSQSIYLLSIPFVKNISVGNSIDFFNRSSIRTNQPTGDGFDNQFVAGRLATVNRSAAVITVKSVRPIINTLMPKSIQ